MNQNRQNIIFIGRATNDNIEKKNLLDLLSIIYRCHTYYLLHFSEHAQNIIFSTSQLFKYTKQRTRILNTYIRYKLLLNVDKRKMRFGSIARHRY